LKHYASTKFWGYFNSLPSEIQKLARQNYSLLKENPSHPSLHFKKVSHGRYCSVLIELHYRAIGISVADGVQQGTRKPDA
jgi:hypothetical protein